MKKYFNLSVVMVLFMTLCLGFASCGGNDDEEDKQEDSKSLIVGKWQMYEATPVDDYEPCDFKGFTEFKDGGVWEYKTGCASGNGTWSVNNDNLTITASLFPVPLSVKIITLNETTLEIKGSLGGYSYVEKYKRLK